MEMIVGHRADSANDTYHSLDEQRCYVDENGIDWLIIQKRDTDSMDDATNFNRSWTEYKHGFGALTGDYWYGNDLLHQLTSDDDMVLRVMLESWDGHTIDLEYGLFRVDSEEYNYNLIIGEPRFNDSKLDSLSYHNLMDFSTYDRRNDRTDANGTASCCSCAVSYGGGWWFNE